MDIKELRDRIDEIDDGLLELFRRRMDVSAEIALYKRRNGMPVRDPAREGQILQSLSQKVAKERESAVIALFSLLFELSRAEQEKLLNTGVI